MTWVKDYKRLYERAAKLATCEFPDGVCMNGESCCTECGYLQPSGRCEIMSLLCKLWICDVKREALPQKTIDELQEIWDEAKTKGYLVFRGTPFTSTEERTVIKTPDGRFQTVRVGSGAGPIEQRSFKACHIPQKK